MDASRYSKEQADIVSEKQSFSPNCAGEFTGSSCTGKLPASTGHFSRFLFHVSFGTDNHYLLLSHSHERSGGSEDEQ